MTSPGHGTFLRAFTKTDRRSFVMRRRTFPFAMTLLLAAAACGPAQVVVTIEVDMDNPEGEGTVTRPLGDLEVQLLPYDRDAIFDSLQAEFSTPEPEIPAELMTARDQVAEAQGRWQQATNRWNTLRDTLQRITDTMDQFSRGEARYVALFREFQEFDSQLGRVEREMESAFTEFDELQRGTMRQSDSVRIMQDNWADEAFAEAFTVMSAKESAAGLRAAADTTDASGVAANFEVPAGRYWVHARYELPYTELYWNVPIDVVRGDPVQVRLTRENAQERIRL
jgi:hypothetical protein